MKAPSLALLFAGFLAACAGDNHVTTQSRQEPSRFAPRTSAGAEVNRPQKVIGKFARDRVYLITRLETADQARGEWRAQGETIKEQGTRIEFTEMGSGKTVSFNAPHQITPTDARSDRSTPPEEDPNQARPPGALYP